MSRGSGRIRHSRLGVSRQCRNAPALVSHHGLQSGHPGDSLVLVGELHVFAGVHVERTPVAEGVVSEPDNGLSVGDAQPPGGVAPGHPERPLPFGHHAAEGRVQLGQDQVLLPGQLCVPL